MGVARQPPFFMVDKNFSDIVVIGGVAAGPKTAASLARRLAKAKITLFQKEQHISYATCGLPYFASGDIESFEKLTMTPYKVVRSPDFFARSKGFRVITGAEVLAIHRDKKTVTVKKMANGAISEHGYDKLVLATGAVPNLPPFPVAQNPNIRSFTKPEDAIHFRKLAETGKIGEAIIVGAGFIGCELAETCGGMWGIATTLMERECQLLPYVLDVEMARLVQKELAKNKVEVLTGCKIEKIEMDNRGTPVVIEGNKERNADYVFLCLGVHPENTLARECGLSIGKSGGIEVNRQMQTSDPNIYAGGDCVESTHAITDAKFFLPMGSLANRHGHVIAENLAGHNVEFTGVVGAFLVKVFGVNVGSVGLSQQAAEKAGLKAKAVWGTFPDKPDYYPDMRLISLKMVYDERDGRLLGLQAVGSGDICRRIDVFSCMLQNKRHIEDLLAFEHGYAPPYSEALDPLYHMATIAQAQQRGVIEEINPCTDFAKPGEVVWLDVREKSESSSDPCPFAGKHVNIPLNELRDTIKDIDANRKIIVICKRGSRSYQAAIMLRQAGFKDVHILGGGTFMAF